MITSYVLVASLAIALGLSWAIAAETFDRALHRVDPTYRNPREILRGLLAEPLGAMREFSSANVYFAKAPFRHVEDPTVEELRKRVLRLFVAFAAFVFPGLPLVLLVAAGLNRIGPGVLETVVIALQLGIGANWARRLIQSLREPDRSWLVPVYELFGIVAAIGAVVFAFQNRNA